MHIPKLFCGTCGVEMVPRKTGLTIEVHAKSGPYYKTSTDAWICNGCRTVVYCGHRAAHAVYEEGYDKVTARDRVDLAEVRGHYCGQLDSVVACPPERSAG